MNPIDRSANVAATGAGGRRVVDLGIEGIGAGRQIGRGGSATVFRARQDSLDRDVAVKVLHSGWDETIQRRFERERHAMGQLSIEDGVLTVYEVGETTEGAPYIVMPFVEGGSLRDLIEAEGPLEWLHAAELIVSVGRSVAVAHDAGVIHRDLKPANILMLNGSTPVVTDFGLARLATSETASQSAVASFTPAYSAPESLDPNRPTTQIDVYGLGATLWALIAGRPPFTEPGQKQTVSSLLRSVLLDQPGDLSDRAPAGISRVIAKAMSKDPDDRQPDARAFVVELDAAIRAEAAGAPAALLADSEQTATVSSLRGVRTGAGATATSAVIETANSSGRGHVLGIVAAMLLVFAIAGTAAATVFGRSGSSEEVAVLLRPADDPSAQRGTVNGISFVARDPETGDFLDDEGNVVAPAGTPVENIVYQDPPSAAVVLADETVVVEIDPAGPAVAAPEAGTNPTIPDLPGTSVVTTVGDSTVTTTSQAAQPDDDTNEDNNEDDTTSTVVAEPLPVISGLSGVSVTETSARVVFTTNTCTTATYSGSIGSHVSPGWPDANARCWTSHGTTFSGLSAGTSYTVSVEVRDKQGRSATRSLTIMTETVVAEPLPVISGLSGVSVTETSARVVFTTNTCTTATYSGSIGSHVSPGWPDANARCWTSHGTTFSGLSAGTSYTVSVEVRDKQGRSATRSLTIMTETVVAEPLPVISGLSGVSVTETSARVVFTTNTCTTATYSGSIGSHVSPGWPDANARCWTSHGTTFSGLSAGTSYTVSVEVRDKQGRSATRSLTIMTETVVAEPLPVISGLSGVSVTETSARVVFTTNTCTTATYSGSIGSHVSPGWPDANARCWTSHGTTFSGLSAGTSYTVSVEVRDKQGRSATRSLTITTASAEPVPDTTPDTVPVESEPVGDAEPDAEQES